MKFQPEDLGIAFTAADPDMWQPDPPVKTGSQIKCYKHNEQQRRGQHAFDMHSALGSTSAGNCYLHHEHAGKIHRNGFDVGVEESSTVV